MTRQEFLRRNVECKRRARISMFLFACVFIALFAGVLFPTAGPGRFVSAFGIACLVGLCVSLVAVLWFCRNQARSAGVACPSCDGGLLGHPGKVVIATGNCPHCGK